VNKADQKLLNDLEGRSRLLLFHNSIGHI